MTLPPCSLNHLLPNAACFYLAAIYFEFSTGFIARYDVHRMLIMRGTSVAGRYIQHGGFWVDLIATLSIVPEILASAIAEISSSWYKAFYLFRLLRLLRVVRLLRGMWVSSIGESPLSRAFLARFNTATLYLVNILFVFLTFLNLLGCMWWFIAELEGLENSWAAQTGE